jgi:glycerate kinase
MKILIATDSFKDALSALAACQAIDRGLRRARPEIETVLFPLSDGGEGVAEILTFHSGGQTVEITVHDPLFRPVKASYGLSPDGHTAFIEMAAASGLQLLKPKERQVLKTSTLGTGELIWDAIRRGVHRILLGIGGSATNDAGTGMATALGYQFLDENGRPVSPVGGKLEEIVQIDDSSLLFDPQAYHIEVLCDVNNPLYGERGAARVYAAQKGADQAAIDRLDTGLHHLAILLEEKFGKDFAPIPGAGAAGGLGAGAMAFLGAQLRSGIDAVLTHTRFEDHLQGVDLILTGEGKIDAQTLHGKLIQGITGRAAKHQIPVIALCGTLTATPEQVQAIGLRAAFSILARPVSLPTAIAETAAALEDAAFHVLKAWS